MKFDLSRRRQNFPHKLVIRLVDDEGIINVVVEKSPPLSRQAVDVEQVAKEISPAVEEGR